MTKTVRDVLTHAKNMILLPKNWCQGQLVVCDANGEDIKICAVRAVAKAAAGTWHFSACLEMLNEACGEHLVRFNDTCSHSALMATFDRAIDSAQTA